MPYRVASCGAAPGGIPTGWQICQASSPHHYSAAKSAFPAQNRDALEAFTLPLEMVPFDAATAIAYGPVRANLERQGTPSGAMDLLIAAHALNLHVILVTNNSREFARVPGLQVENWV